MHLDISSNCGPPPAGYGSPLPSCVGSQLTFTPSGYPADKMLAAPCVGGVYGGIVNLHAVFPGLSFFALHALFAAFAAFALRTGITLRSLRTCCARRTDLAFVTF